MTEVRFLSLMVTVICQRDNRLVLLVTRVWLTLPHSCLVLQQLVQGFHFFFWLHLCHWTVLNFAKSKLLTTNLANPKNLCDHTIFVSSRRHHFLQTTAPQISGDLCVVFIQHTVHHTINFTKPASTSPLPWFCIFVSPRYPLCLIQFALVPISQESRDLLMAFTAHPIFCVHTVAHHAL